MSGTGKSPAMKMKMKGLLKHKQLVQVYTGVGDTDWPSGVKLTLDPDQLERNLRDPRFFGSHVFLDEAPVLFEETKRSTHPKIWQLGQLGKHSGFSVTYATQWPTGIPKSIRTQCARADVFRLQNEDYAASVVKDRGLPKSYVDKILSLQKGVFIRIDHGKEPVQISMRDQMKAYNRKHGIPWNE